MKGPENGEKKRSPNVVLAYLAPPSPPGSNGETLQLINITIDYIS
jgi:hypothetical protein